jgi:hypothetical protein
VEDVLGEDQLGFRRGKGTGDAMGMLRIISERALNIDEVLRTCFIDRQKAFNHVNWTKFMQIQMVTCFDWCERRLINKLYMDQIVELNWIRWRQEL